ncbi:MAG: M20/M25/M40 family metallo-hydrolase, partial [Clostridia bacterium]|nr:M20/M25/M40 family metallo-hydrolase [Clostridia bacterium]
MKNLLQELEFECGLFGPSGFEVEVRDYLKERLEEVGYTTKTDAIGNLMVEVGDTTSPYTLLVEAHMDEVGMMITEIGENGCLSFGCVGGIDPRVLCGKRVIVRGKDQHDIPGVIASKPIHLQSKEERSHVTKADRMYIDIGVSSREEAESLVDLGDFAMFDSPFVVFGEPEVKVKGKAIDDRLGCAVMLRALLRLKEEGISLPYRCVFSFGTREEVGFSGAKPVTFRVRPTHAFILESTAIADLADVPKASRVADQGCGGALSLADNGTIYDSSMIAFAQETAKKEGIAVQVKRYVSGGNNAKHIQQSV